MLSRKLSLLPVISLVGLWLYGWWLRLWFALEVIDQPAPHTLDTGNVVLAGLQVLVHVVQHSVSPFQDFTLTHQLLHRQTEESERS